MVTAISFAEAAATTTTPINTDVKEIFTCNDFNRKTGVVKYLILVLSNFLSKWRKSKKVFTANFYAFAVQDRLISVCS